MQTRLERVAGILSKLSTAALWLAGLGLVLMTAFVAWQVFGRYVLNRSPSWTEPAAVMLMSWFIFLGAAVGVRENYHSASTCCSTCCPTAARRCCARCRTSPSSPSASAWSGTAASWSA